MAITKDSSGSLTSRYDHFVSGYSSFTRAYEVHTGSNFLLVRIQFWRDGGTTVASITWQGMQNFTLVGGYSVTGDRIEIWRLNNPMVGSGNVVATFAATVNEGSLCIDAWQGVNTSTPTGTFAGTGNNSNTNSISIDVPSSTGDLVVDCLATYRNTTISVGANQTIDVLLDEDRVINSLGCSRETAAGSPTIMSWSWSPGGNDMQIIGGVALKPALGIPVESTPMAWLAHDIL